jgi:hypothetical protein
MGGEAPPEVPPVDPVDDIEKVLFRPEEEQVEDMELFRL